MFPLLITNAEMAVRSVCNLGKLFSNSRLNCLTVSSRGYKKYKRITSMELKKRQDLYLEEMSPKERLELEKRNKFSDWNYSAEIFAFGKRLQEDFRPELLVQAFTHRSYRKQEEDRLREIGVENSGLNLKDNDDLAVEGEKIISNYVPRYVSHFFPRFPLEGINAIHDYLLSEEVLAKISENLGTKFLILSTDYPVESATFSKTLKAIIGALYECQNLNKANLFVRDFIVTQMAGKDVNDFFKISNPLDVLNEILERDGKKKCEPRIICQTAVNTILANYHVGLYCNKQLIGHNSGECIDTAIDMAAFDALRRLFHTTESCSPITYNLEQLPDTVSNLSLKEWNSAAFEKQSSIKA